MEKESVQSSIIRSLCYDSNTSTLEVEFNSSAVWQYYDVPKSIYYDMRNADPIGKYFNANIRG
ncbi:KTSC domain-containing protein [Pedobacter sp. BS3]|uniref:KTSC domain-containing protein n=1 Tax=Pedobacter sp. BS3 TaxID=2567937 RepID=UPI0011EFBAAF|nr:KTSC domain-containing protein [Pedobacter sp. BS3]